jgi:hypothetical protein
MAELKEIGWNELHDEGVRLIASHSNFSGIKANLTLPTVFNCDSKESYFNFYLGINFTNNQAVEAGISYSMKPVPGTNEIRPHWRVFVNPPGNPVEIRHFNPQGITMPLKLDCQGKVATLYLGECPVAFGEAKGEHGYVKMVAAIHEAHGKTLDRTTRFDRIKFEALQVRKVGRTDWLTIDKIVGLKWKCERQDSAHFTMHPTSELYQNYVVTMENVQNAGSVGKAKGRAG